MLTIASRLAAHYYGKMQVEKLPIIALTEDPANARKHGKKNLQAIAASIKQWGQVEPLVVRKSTLCVIGGNGRLSVMRGMGMTEAECVVLDIDATQATALGLALNRTSELATWDPEQLGGLLKALDEDGFDLGELGWSDDDIEPLLAADWTPGPLNDDDEKGATEVKLHKVAFMTEQYQEVQAAIMEHRRRSQGHPSDEAETLTAICREWRGS